MNQENSVNNQPTEEYRMFSTRGLRLLSFGGYINTIMKISGEKLSFDMHPKKLNKYPEVNISDIASVEQGKKISAYHMIFLVCTCYLIVTIPFFRWLGSNTTVKINLKNGDQIIMYSANKNNGIRCYEALQKKIGEGRNA